MARGGQLAGANRARICPCDTLGHPFCPLCVKRGLTGRLPTGLAVIGRRRSVGRRPIGDRNLLAKVGEDGDDHRWTCQRRICPCLVCVSPDPGVRETRRPAARRRRDRADVPGRRRAARAADRTAPSRRRRARHGARPRAGHRRRDHQVRWRGTPLPLTRLEVRADRPSWPASRCGCGRTSACSPPSGAAAYLGDNSILHSAVKRLRRKLRDVGRRPVGARRCAASATACVTG